MVNLAKKVKINEAIENIKRFLKEVELELKKVIWPDRKFVFAATLIVLAIVLLSAGYVLFVDFVLAKIFDLLAIILKGSI